MRLDRAVIAIALALAPAIADAAAETHDGFFLRLAVGRGGFVATAPPEQGHPEGRLVGNGVGFDFAAGAAVIRDLVVHADLVGYAAREPKLTLGTGVRRTIDQTAALNAIGAGVTWYFGPNAYLSGALGAARLTLYDVDNTVLSQTGRGPSLHAMIGREWWVTDRWGLGAGASLFLGWLPDGRDSWTFASLGVLLSATFN